MKFILKPVDAMLFTQQIALEKKRFPKPFTHLSVYSKSNFDYYFINTPDGLEQIFIGDWIVDTGNGTYEIYDYKTFKHIYAEV